MNHKQKAKELVLKFTRIEDDTVFYWQPYYDRKYSDAEIFPHAKKCALKCCEELLTQCWEYRDTDLQESYEYWTKVKEELLKM